MPPPIRVEIVAYSEAWPELAGREMERLARALGPVLCAGVHAVGSTAVPGLAAKPILDLMPVVADLSLLDEAVPILERLGYRGWGELGIVGRRYFTRDDEAGQRVAQLHCFAQASPMWNGTWPFGTTSERTRPSPLPTRVRSCGALRSIPWILMPTLTARRTG